MNAPRQRLYWRFFIPLGVSLLVVTLLAWVLASRLLSGVLEARQQQQLDATADLLADQGLPFTPDLLARVADLLDVGLVLFSASGTAVLSAGRGSEKIVSAVTESHRLWREGGTPSGVTFVTDGSRYRATLRSLPATRDTRYASVAVTASLADLEAATARTAQWLGLAALAGLMLLAWIGHLLARGITAPVSDLALLADRLAAGDREARVAVGRDDEIGSLARALNRMAERLQAYENEVAAASRHATLGQLAGRLAHEVRNPLTAMKLQLELLAERGSDDIRETVAGLLDEVRRLELIVTSHLELGRDAPLDPRPTDLNGLLRGVGDLLRPQLAHRHVTLRLELDGALPDAPLDADRMRQVLLNLLVNAADALPGGGTVLVSSAVDANAVRVDVEDDGPGIDPALRERLFAPSVSGKPGGLGVGLALSREIVVAHGGTLAAGGSATLGGARFRITLPLAGEERR